MVKCLDESLEIKRGAFLGTPGVLEVLAKVHEQPGITYEPLLSFLIEWGSENIRPPMKCVYQQAVFRKMREEAYTGGFLMIVSLDY